MTPDTLRLREAVAVFQDNYRCPEGTVQIGHAGTLLSDPQYFRFDGVLCYGRLNEEADATGSADLGRQVHCHGARIDLPFNLSDVITNLQRERYAPTSQGYSAQLIGSGASRSAYYQLRPFLPLAIRKRLQRIALRGWDQIEFPHWPVDLTVQNLLERLMVRVLEQTEQKTLPFIWFWPEAAAGCAVMTHDVEGRAGLDFCDELMDLDESCGVTSAFQIVPEARYVLPSDFPDRFRRRGFEVNVHDLDHDGRLFQDRDEFLRRAVKINEYATRFGSRGFRAGVMYRKQDWFDALDVSYDMSVPNVAHLEPQRGGCCSVMPYFVGRILELPLTTIQDYSLFHILGQYSIDLWKAQAELILTKHGLISFIAHPDYIIEKRARAVYQQLLKYVRELREYRNVWVALPGDVDRWWRNRCAMRLIRTRDGWRIEGPDHHRARVAYATVRDNRLVYDVSAGLH
jgi:hypothetical protein